MAGTGITPTLKGATFGDTFIEVQHPTSLGLLNSEQLRLFHLSVQNNRFNYTDLTKFIRRNLGSYVFSRAEIEDYRRSDDVESIALEAVERIRAQQGDGGLGEILLYVLLEQILEAPKALSKIELERAAGQVTSRGDAIHVLAPGGQAPTNCLVFGTSNVVGDIEDAIDQAFDRVVAIRNNQATECQLAEQTIFTKTTDPATANTIKDLLVPQRGANTGYDTAFSMFLGYNLGLAPGNYSNEAYRAQLDQKMRLDISHHASYITWQIQDRGLSAYSFYIYVLPLDDVSVDPGEIMTRVLNGGA